MSIHWFQSSHSFPCTLVSQNKANTSLIYFIIEVSLHPFTPLHSSSVLALTQTDSFLCYCNGFWIDIFLLWFPICVSCQFIAFPLQIHPCLPRFKIWQMDPINIAPLPKDTMLGFVNQRYQKDAAKPQQREGFVLLILVLFIFISATRTMLST